ncbi:3-hydroxyacyl-CoA dehydrogenase NAD-binding domain-containing protein [Ramlibacter monticola]|nr:3-hydroxyacyl-CoA dehydrogenase family protein [Ramlibacter monticola]
MMNGRLSVAIVGAGLMGHGIGQVFARAGHRVVLTDPAPDVLAQAIPRVEQNLRAEGVDAAGVVCNLSTQPDLRKAVSGADLVIEAAPEKLELKHRIFTEVAAAAPSHAVLASNTSVIPITRIGEPLDADARGRLVGTHWWNPPHLIPLVEVVRSEYTRMDVFEQTFAWLAAVGKAPVKVHRDVTGFIGNRLQHALWREAIALVAGGVCDAEAIDTVVKNSFGLRMPVLGPMENADLVGLELTRDVHRVLFPDLHEDKAPSPLLDRLIAQGHGGMRSGQGLRPWTPAAADEVRRALATHLIRMLESRAAGR